MSGSVIFGNDFGIIKEESAGSGKRRIYAVLK